MILKIFKKKEMRDEVGLLRRSNEDLMYRLLLNASKDKKNIIRNKIKTYKLYICKFT